MEYPKFHPQKSVLNLPKVIKVVNLKRFTPDPHSDIIPKSKRSKNSPIVSRRSLNGSNNTLDCNRYQNFNSMIPTNQNQENLSTIDKSSDIQKIDMRNKEMCMQGSKIKFRNCSHTDEELSTLHECVDDTLVKIGDTFDSRETFKQYLNANAKRWYYYYVCRNSKQKVVEYNCICMAYNIKQREVVIRKQKKRTTACPCKIRLTIDKTNNLVVYYVCNHHDHPTTASAFHDYPHAKYLPQHIKDEFLDLIYLGLNVDLIQKYIHSVVGLTIKKKDIWSYAYRFKRKIYNRIISEERQKFMEGLIRKIQDTHGELDTNQQDLPSSHTEVLLSIKDVELRQKNSITFTSTQEENPIVPLETLTDKLTLNEDLLRVLGEASSDTEIIVQYLDEEGILCDENGIPITNSSAIIEFINNYTEPHVLHQTVHNELDISEQVYPLDWANTVVLESEPCVEETEGSVLNDAELDTSGSERQEESVQSDSFDYRLSPTPDTPAMYVDMDNFRKYYYVDHRYTLYEDQKTKELRVPQYTNRNSGIDSSVKAGEEFVKENYIIGTLTDKLTLNEDLLKVLGEASSDTEIIVQYIDEEGILCDENGTPITNSSAIIEFINNYAESHVLHQTVHNELDISEHCANTVVLKSEPCVEETEGSVLNDAELDTNGSKRQEESVQSDSFDDRLSPTPDTSALHVNMDNFRKYYYVDHRYISYEDKKTKELRVPEDTNRNSGTHSSVKAGEEFVKVQHSCVQDVGL